MITLEVILFVALSFYINSFFSVTSITPIIIFNILLNITFSLKFYKNSLRKFYEKEIYLYAIIKDKK